MTFRFLHRFSLCGLAFGVGAMLQGATAVDPAAVSSPTTVESPIAGRMTTDVFPLGANAADDLAARVIILANSADANSVAIARHYAVRRGVPMSNIFALKLPVTETMTRSEFETTLFQPLQDELVRRKWIDGIEFNPPMPVSGSDPLAPHRKYAMLGHRISYLVVCRGVPLRVAQDDSRPLDSKIAQVSSNFKTNSAAVDSELALLAQSGWPISAFVPNPLFRNDHPISLTEGLVVKVGRLDGPTVADAMGLVDLALAGEAAGLVGRGYIDIGGPHAEGDKWLEAAAKELATLGFDTDVDRNPTTIPPEARFDAPVLYFGWYDGAMHGPFLRAGFRFPPGAVALHIYSYSASSMDSPNSVWVPALVARGVTGTFGNVNEPYLQFTHQPQLILQALARGETLGDAAAYAIPAFSWMAILVGDPLYRPFKISFDEQWRDRANLPPEQQVFLVLRRMRLLAAAGKYAEAVATGRDAQSAGFNLAVALTLADVQRAAGNRADARRTLAPCLAPSYQPPLDDAALLPAAARQLDALGEPKLALQAWQQLLALQSLPRESRLAWLKPALAAARAVKNTAQAVRWDSELRDLSPPPAGK